MAAFPELAILRTELSGDALAHLERLAVSWRLLSDLSFSDLLLLALVATVLANLLNNLPATLLLVPLVAPLGTVVVLATLVGLNVRSSLTWTGSLANLLWRRTLYGAGVTPSGREFHAIALLTVPVGVAVGVLPAWAWAGVALCPAPDVPATPRPGAPNGRRCGRRFGRRTPCSPYRRFNRCATSYRPPSSWVSHPAPRSGPG